MPTALFYGNLILDWIAYALAAKLLLSTMRAAGGTPEHVATVSEFLTVGSSSPHIPNYRRGRSWSQISVFCQEEPPVRKAVTADTSSRMARRAASGSRVVIVNKICAAPAARVADRFFEFVLLGEIAPSYWGTI